MSDNAAERAPFLNRLLDLPVVDAPGLRWARPANHMQRGVARGGVLYMDETHLGFQPRRIDSLFGARDMSWELSSITDLGLKPGLRKLRVTVTTATNKQRFIVTDPEVVWNDLNAWLKKQEGGASA
jgi:hypothetical protein